MASDAAPAAKPPAVAPPPCAGIINLGATDFVNVIVQVLYAIPEVRRTVYSYRPPPSGRPEHDITLQLQLLFLAMQECSARTSAHALTKSFGWGTRDILQQHDTHEFLLVLCDSMKKLPLLRPMEMLFTSYIQGLCGHTSELDEESVSFSLALESKASATLIELIERFFAAEMLELDNQYRCSMCNKKVDARKGFRAKTLPRVLTLSVKRREYDYMTDKIVRNTTGIAFPMWLVVPLEEKPPSTAPTLVALANEAELSATYLRLLPAELLAMVKGYVTGPQYDLFAVIANRGSHNVVYIQPPGHKRFYYISDTTVKEADPAWPTEVYSQTEEFFYRLRGLPWDPISLEEAKQLCGQ